MTRTEQIWNWVSALAALALIGLTLAIAAVTARGALVAGGAHLSIQFTNLAQPETSIFAASAARIIVDGSTAYVPAGGVQMTQAVVCGQALLLTLQDAPGKTNEIEWSSDLVHWTPANVWWVSRGLPIKYYAPAPLKGCFFRARSIL
jgi:hypothetical protein